MYTCRYTFFDHLHAVQLSTCTYTLCGIGTCQAVVFRPYRTDWTRKPKNCAGVRYHRVIAFFLTTRPPKETWWPKRTPRYRQAVTQLRMRRRLASSLRYASRFSALEP